jgi:hypothetical protein
MTSAAIIKSALFAGIVFAGSLTVPTASAQELYNPVPGALAVNSALEKYKEDSTGVRMPKRSIQAKFDDCRAYVTRRHPAGSESWRIGMRLCEKTRQERLSGLRSH